MDPFLHDFQHFLVQKRVSAVFNSRIIPKYQLNNRNGRTDELASTKSEIRNLSDAIRRMKSEIDILQQSNNAMKGEIAGFNLLLQNIRSRWEIKRGFEDMMRRYEKKF